MKTAFLWACGIGFVLLSGCVTSHHGHYGDTLSKNLKGEPVLIFQKNESYGFPFWFLIELNIGWFREISLINGNKSHRFSSFEWSMGFAYSAGRANRVQKFNRRLYSWGINERKPWVDSLLDERELHNSPLDFRPPYSNYICSGDWVYYVPKISDTDIPSFRYKRMSFCGFPIMMSGRGFTGTKPFVKRFNRITGEVQDVLRVYEDFTFEFCRECQP